MLDTISELYKVAFMSNGTSYLCLFSIPLVFEMLFSKTKS